MTAIFQTDLI